MITSNQSKFINKNPIQKGLVANFHRQFVKLLDHTNPKAILEVGCGEGYLMAEITKKITNVELVGMDINKTAIEEGQRLWPALKFRLGDVYQIDYPDNSWDTVVASEVLEHLDRPEQALHEICRVSSRQIMLSVPYEPWFRLGNLARGRHLKRFGNHPEHVNLWSPSSFSRLVSRHARIKKLTISFPWIIVQAEV